VAARGAPVAHSRRHATACLPPGPVKIHQCCTASGIARKGGCTEVLLGELRAPCVALADARVVSRMAAHGPLLRVLAVASTARRHMHVLSGPQGAEVELLSAFHSLNGLPLLEPARKLFSRTSYCPLRSRWSFARRLLRLA